MKRFFFACGHHADHHYRHRRKGTKSICPICKSPEAKLIVLKRRCAVCLRWFEPAGYMGRALYCRPECKKEMAAIQQKEYWAANRKKYNLEKVQRRKEAKRNQEKDKKLEKKYQTGTMRLIKSPLLGDYWVLKDPKDFPDLLEKEKTKLWGD